MVLSFLPGFWCPFCLSLFLQTFTCFRIIPSHSRHLHVCPFRNGCVHYRTLTSVFRTLSSIDRLSCLFPVTSMHFRTCPSNFEHLGPSHNNSVRISTLASVWLPFRNTCSCFHAIPSKFGQLSPFWKKNQNDVLLGCFTVKTQKRKGKKENCTLNPHPSYESLSIGKRKDPGGEGGSFEHLYLFVSSRRHFVSTKHAQTLHVISMYLWTGYFAPNRPLEKEKKNIYIYK